MKLKFISFIVIFLLILSSCKKLINQPEIDDQLIKTYLSDNGLSAVKDASGLYYIMTVTGTGTSPTTASTIEVKYKGSLLNGTVFDQTATDATFSYTLSGLILGWQIGIPLMKKGGKATFFVPSSLGYGSTDLGVVPPNSVLKFEIELVDVK